MNTFVNLRDTLQSLQADPSTSQDPVKRMFICDGEFVTANIAISGESGALHTQPDHDEIIVVLEGEADFRVGDEVDRIGPNHLVFIPRNTVHGPVRLITSKFAALSIYAPYFDRAKKNIVWEKVT